MEIKRTKGDYAPKLIRRSDGVLFCLNGVYWLVLQAMLVLDKPTIGMIGRVCNLSVSNINKIIACLAKTNLFSETIIDSENGEKKYTADEFQQFDTKNITSTKNDIVENLHKCKVVEFEDGRMLVVDFNSLCVLNRIRDLPGNTIDEHRAHFKLASNTIGAIISRLHEYGAVDRFSTRYGKKVFNTASLVMQYKTHPGVIIVDEGFYPGLSKNYRSTHRQTV